MDGPPTTSCAKIMPLGAKQPRDFCRFRTLRLSIELRGGEVYGASGASVRLSRVFVLEKVLDRTGGLARAVEGQM